MFFRDTIGHYDEDGLCLLSLLKIVIYKTFTKLIFNVGYKINVFYIYYNNIIEDKYLL